MSIQGEYLFALVKEFDNIKYFLTLLVNFFRIFKNKGNMWAQSWGNLFEMLAPYPDATKVDLTQILKDKNFTTEKIFRVKKILLNFLINFFLILFSFG
jgi:hypothetical protein